MRKLATSTLVWSLSAACVGSVLGCSGSVEDPPDASTGSTSQAIQHGILDTGGLLPAVGRIREPISGSECTGILVASKWVLTARHCFETDGPIMLKRDYTFSIDYNADGVADWVYDHKYENSGKILLPGYWTESGELEELAGLSDSDTSRDVALIRLDTAVPPNVAMPHGIAGVGPFGICSFPDEGKGTNVGHGRTHVTLPSLVEVNLGKRSYATTEGWAESSECGTDSSSCASRWVFDEWNGGYGEVNPGDSGGPVFMGHPSSWNLNQRPRSSITA